MKYLLIILLLFGCPAAKQYKPHSLLNIEKGHYVVYNQPQFPENYHQIEYIGNWKHMDQGGSWANNESDTARYRFWGYGIQIMTELMHDHGAYKVFIDGKYIESINVKDSSNTANNLTYSNMELRTGNHVLEIVPNGLMVLNKLGVYYYADPDPNETVYDTIYIDRIDTVYIEKLDSIYIHDTTYIDKLIEVHDTTYIDIFEYFLLSPIKYDTIKMN